MNQIETILSDLHTQLIILNSLAGCDDVQIAVAGVLIRGNQSKIKSQIIRLLQTFENLENLGGE